MGLTLPQYLFEVTCCLAVFYVFYALALAQTTFFQWNRIYLLATPILSFIVPGLDFSVNAASVPLIAEASLPTFDLAEALGEQVPARLMPYLAGFSMRFADLFFLIYFGGIAILGFRLLDGLWYLFQLIQVYSHEKHGGYTQVKGGFPGASFFSFLFYDQSPLDERDRMILAHERVHIRQWHSLDVVLMEGMVILKWFNPLIYLYRRQLKLTHEYLADRYVVKTFGKPSAYQQLLRSVARAEPPRPGLVSPFAGYSDQRLRMLAKQPCPPHRAWLYGMVAPLLLLLMALFSFNWVDRQPLGRELLAYSQALDGMSRHTMLTFGPGKTVDPPELSWSIHKLPLKEVQTNGLLEYEVQQIDPHFFRDLQRSRLSLEEGGRLLEIANVQARLAIGQTGELWEAHSTEMLFKMLQTLPLLPEVTLYLRIRDEKERTWMAIIAVTREGEVYQDKEAVGSLLEEAALLRWTFGNQKRTIAITPRKEPDFLFRWGPIETPLELYANPNVYAGYVEVTLEDMASIIGADMKFVEKGAAQEIESIKLTQYALRGQDYKFWIPTIEDGFAHFRRTDQAYDLLASIQPGGDLSLNARVQGKWINTLHIHVVDPLGLFNPVVAAPKINREPVAFGFQVISREGFKTRLKIDTTASDVQRILDMYRDPERFEILHVPGFRTRERLISENRRDPFLPFAEIEGPAAFFTDHLPEYTDYADRDVRMNWGDLFATPNSVVYAFEEFLENRTAPLSLRVGQEYLTLEKAIGTAFTKGEAAEVFLMEMSDFLQPEKVSVLEDLAPGTSLAFRNIAVSDSSGTTYYFPVNFVFQIGYSQTIRPEMLLIEEVAADGSEPEKVVSDEQIAFKHFPLSALIAELMGKKLNRIVFEGMETDPLLHVQLNGKGYSPGGAYDIILNGLEKKFRFRSEWERVEKLHWRIQVQYPDRLDKALYAGAEEEVEKVRVFDPEGFHLFTGITLYELADYLEDRFDTVFGFFPNRYGSERFIFGLDFSNFESVRRQLLEEYGLECFEAETLYDGLKVQFFQKN